MSTETALHADELRLLEQTMATVLGGIEGPGLVEQLAELGWFELWQEQSKGAARALFGQQGRLARTSPMLSRLMGGELVGVLPSGPPDPAAPVLLPEPVAFGADGWPAAAPDGRVRVLAQADALDAAPDGAGEALLAIRRDGDRQLLRVEVGALDRVPVQGLDPAMRLCRVDATDAVRSGTPLAAGKAAERGWARAVALGRRLLAEEMCGVVAAQLQLAVRHAGSRAQFGRPIGSFQAVKHKLAEVHVALAVAELAADEAWADPTPTTCLLATVLAGAAVETANLHCQQVLGGMGFTWEHPFHRYLRRGRVLAALLGSRAQLARSLGADILAARATPVLAPLS